jgi:serine acetyltransferase
MNATFGHDVIVGDHCVFSPGVHLSGWVKIGNGCLLGAGAVLLERVQIGDNVTVGSGAVVVQNLPSDLTVWGVPARPLMYKEKAQVNGRDNYAV